MPQGIVGLPRAPADSRGGRAVRTAVFAAVTLGLAVVAHRVAGGGREPAGFPVAFAGLLVLGWVLSRRERSGRVIALTVVTSQLALHLSFVLPGLLQLRRAGGAGGPTDAQLSALLFCHHGSTPISRAQLHQAAAGLDLGAYGSAPAGPSPTSLVVRATLMLLLHLVAAVMVAAWLRRGERAAWRHWVTVLRCGQDAVRPVLAVAPPRRVPARSSAAVVARFWFSPRALRGPPARPSTSSC